MLRRLQHHSSAAMVAVSTTLFPSSLSHIESRRHIAAHRSLRDDQDGLETRTDAHGDPLGPGFLDINAPSLDTLDTTDMMVDKRAYGIPFKIDDEKAQDICCEHHGTAVEVRKAERFMIPFWLAATSAGGDFKAEIFRQHPGSQHQVPVWDDAPPFKFTYPFEDHHIFNQVAATYEVPPAVCTETLRGNHIPSMLISRWELLEELEEMKNSPRLLNFHLSVPTAVKILGTRVNRDLLQLYARKELRKFYPNGTYLLNIRLMGVLFEVMKLRPVFLPLYRLHCATVSHPNMDLPTYICGATGKVTGPKIHAQIRHKFAIGAAGAFTGLAATAPFFGPLVGSAAALGGSYAAVHARHFKATTAAKMEVEQTHGLAERERIENAEADDSGYKWKVEDEEKYEYEFREVLREKARRRMRFEQRVQEEMDQDDAKASHDKNERNYRGAKPRRQRRPGQVDKDPLGYYRILNLKGKEGKADKSAIAKAFRSEAQKTHPDVVAIEKQEEAKAKMQKLVEAYNVLRDQKLRAEYDTGTLFSIKSEQEQQ